jgi:hypothetical protein
MASVVGAAATSDGQVVFYELSCSTCTLFLPRDAGCIRFATPLP